MAQLGAPKEFGLPKISDWAQSTVPGRFHNITVFMICTMGMWIFHSGHHVDFEQWLGQVDQEDLSIVPLCRVLTKLDLFNCRLCTFGFRS